MSKVTVVPVLSLNNAATAVTTINNNETLLAGSFDNTLSRDGTSPNQMEANIDMNSFRIINVPEPVNSTDVANKEYVDAQVVTAINYAAFLLAFFATLPTTLPATSGVLWNNGGVISLS